MSLRKLMAFFMKGQYDAAHGNEPHSGSFLRAENDMYRAGYASESEPKSTPKPGRFNGWRGYDKPVSQWRKEHGDDE